MKIDDSYGAIWRRLRSDQPRPVTLLVLSVLLGCACAGLGMAGGWLYGALFQRTPGTPIFSGRVNDEDIMWGLIAGGVAWVIVLGWAWRPLLRQPRGVTRGARRLVIALVGTVIISGGMVGLGVFLERIRSVDDIEYLIAGLAMIAGAGVILLWLPLVYHQEAGHAVEDDGGRIIVNCPQCGYSLNGLRSLTCPECGEAFSIDEIIRAQHYATPTSKAD